MEVEGVGYVGMCSGCSESTSTLRTTKGLYIMTEGRRTGGGVGGGEITCCVMMCLVLFLSVRGLEMLCSKFPEIFSCE